jgi:hypothetical protein
MKIAFYDKHLVFCFQKNVLEARFGQSIFPRQANKIIFLLNFFTTFTIPSPKFVQMISVQGHNDPIAGISTGATGVYCIAIQNLTARINQGKALKFQTFFTGMGQIDRPTMLLTPSSTIFDPDKSIIRNNLSIVDEDSLMIAASNNNFDPKGCNISLSRGEDHDDWELSTFFFDLNPAQKASEDEASLVTTQVAIDKKNLTSSPFSFVLKTKKRVKPGFYTIDVLFTYFNGKDWQSDAKVIQFKVLNFFEKYIELIGLIWKYWIGTLRSKF